MHQVGLLSIVVWLPIAGGLITLGLGDRQARAARWVALITSLLTLACCVPLYTRFTNGTAEFQFIERVAWIPTLHAQYYLGVDGISLPLILLTAFMTVPVIITGWTVIEKRPAQYFAAFLLMEGLMIGVFAAMDALLFYFFWEAMLIPMFVIIGIWGGPRRVYATLKFFLYTFLGSVLMLVALIYLYEKTGNYTIAGMQAMPLSLIEQRWIFFAFLIAFAVKVPMWPVHTWLPDAHVEAPTGGSVILAAILLKMGGYGLLRFSLPIVPDASRQLDWLVLALSLIAILYIALVALVQTDMKKLIAYSSIAHMGFVTLGAFLVFLIVAATGSIQGATFGMDGAEVQMISHGLISGALFLCVGVMYDRLHTREISAYGGVINVMPIFGAFMVLFALANSGLPGTSGFVGEFLVILSSFRASFWYALLAATILIFGAAYNLWLVKRVIFGQVANDKVAHMPELNAREFGVLGVLAIAVIVLGVWPAPMLNMMDASVHHLVQQVVSSKVPLAAGTVPVPLQLALH
jgi:NADH-quinone oxidoreductase subunit M